MDNAKKPMFIQDFLKSKKNPQFALKYTDEVINETAARRAPFGICLPRALFEIHTVTT